MQFYYHHHHHIGIINNSTAKNSNHADMLEVRAVHYQQWVVADSVCGLNTVDHPTRSTPAVSLPDTALYSHYRFLRHVCLGLLVADLLHGARVDSDNW